MLHFLNSLDYPGKDPKIAHAPDPLIVGRAEHVVHRSDHILGTSMHPSLRHGPDNGAPNGPDGDGAIDVAAGKK